MNTVFIGCGAGFAGDRFDAALPVIAHLSHCDGPRYLIYEVLGERTVALALKEKLKNPEAGYSPYLDHYLKLSLEGIRKHNIKLVTNMGAANPAAAASRIHELSKKKKLSPFRIAIVEGDDVRSYLDDTVITGSEIIEGNKVDGRELLSANVYLGAVPIAEALATDVDIVLVGRTTDSALVLGPLIHEFGWPLDNLDKMAAGTVAGHLLECGGQVTGAYFADPGFKDVPDMDRLGFPLAEISSDGGIVITKADNTGGCVTTATVTEQLLYEMHDPSAYLVPEVTLDVTGVELREESKNRIRVRGVRGHKPPQKLKATLCVDNGWMAEAEMSYAGMNALARAKLASEIVLGRMHRQGLDESIRTDIIGAYSVLDGGSDHIASAKSLPFEGDYRLRLTLISPNRDQAQLLIDELQSLYCSGPAAGGGFRGQVTEQIATASIMIDRQIVESNVRIREIPA